MADDKYEVKVDIKADAKNLRKEMDKATQHTKKLGSLSEKLKQSGVKGHKDVAKMEKKQKKADQKKFKEAIAKEKELEKAMQQRIKSMKKVQGASEANRQAFLKEYAALNKLSREHGKLQASRQKAGIARGGAGNRASGLLNQMSGSVSDFAESISVPLVGALSMAAGAAVRMVSSQISQGYGIYHQYGTAAGKTIGQGSKEQLSGLLDPAQKLGYSPLQTVGQAHGVARQTGNLGATTIAQKMSRTMGMDVSEAAGFMGILTKAGKGFGGKAGNEGKQELKNILADAFSTSLDHARVPEFIQGVGKLVQLRSAVAAGDVGVGKYSSLLNAMDATDKAGFQGQRGAALATKLHGGIQKPGGGEAGQYMLLKALGWGRKGGVDSYIEALERQEEGASLRNVKEVRNWMKGASGLSKDKFSLLLKNMLGTSISQGKVLYDMDLSKKIQKHGGKADAKDVLEGRVKEAMKEGESHIVTRRARLEKRLLNIGKGLKKPIEFMQDAVLELVDTVMPKITEVLNNLTDKIQGVIKEIDANISWNKALKDAKKEAAAIEKSYKSGKISPQRAREEIISREYHVAKQREEFVAKEAEKMESMNWFEKGVYAYKQAGLYALGADNIFGKIRESENVSRNLRGRRRVASRYAEETPSERAARRRKMLGGHLDSARKALESGELDKKDEKFIKGILDKEKRQDIYSDHSPAEFGEVLNRLVGIIQDLSSQVEDVRRSGNTGSVNDKRGSHTISK